MLKMYTKIIFPFHSARKTAKKSAGYTLIEILLATALSLVLLTSVIRIFLMMNASFGDARSFMHLATQATNAQIQLGKDLGHTTVTMSPPVAPEKESGYFVCGRIPATYNEGNSSQIPFLVDMSVIQNGGQFWVDPNIFRGPGDPDLDALADQQKVEKARELLFKKVNSYIGMTICNHEEPFRFKDEKGVDCETPYGEVAWFVFRNNLYRAFIPVVASRDREECQMFLMANTSTEAESWGNIPYMPKVSDSGIPLYRKVNMGMLGDPRYRFLTAYWSTSSDKTPSMLPINFLIPGGNDNYHDVPFLWGWLHLTFVPRGEGSVGLNDHARTILDNWLVLPNVIQFQVEVWDPKQKRYILLGEELDKTEGTYYNAGSENSKYYLYNYSLYSDAGKENGLRYSYDTWSTLLCNMSYNTNNPNSAKPEDWVEEWTPADYKNNESYMIGTLERPGVYVSTLPNTRSVSPPPYSAPLPGIRVIVQTFDPDTGQVKEFRVAQDFKTH